MKKCLLLILPALLLFACKDRKRDVTLTQPININGAVYTPGQANVPKSTAQVPAATGTSVKTNPAHGQPGHRCELEVGAPLNSTPVTASIPPQVTQQQLPPVSAAIPSNNPQIVTNTTTPVKGSGKMNPAHGQPGHRCDIAVGASLDAPKNAPAVTSTPTPQTTVTPVNTPTLPGMNPQHGQPGHRCDIAVGAPLNSPKTDSKDSSSKS